VISLPLESRPRQTILREPAGWVKDIAEPRNFLASRGNDYDLPPAVDGSHGLKCLCLKFYAERIDMRIFIERIEARLQIRLEYYGSEKLAWS